MHPFVGLMRRYVIDYLLCQNPSVCGEIMEPDYVLHMADVDLTPRDELYVPAVASQFGLFPGMGMTVNDLFVSGDRLAMRFTQHGASMGHEGRLASWAGIGLYRWNGRRLTETFAIEDYESRRIQLAGRRAPVPVEAPMLAPWDVHDASPNPSAEWLVRALIDNGEVLRRSSIAYDDEPAGAASIIVEPQRVAVNDVLSAGSHVACAFVTTGTYVGGLEVPDDFIGRPIALHAVGTFAVSDDGAITGRVIRARGPARRELLGR
jgi:hypothetical protein